MNSARTRQVAKILLLDDESDVAAFVREALNPRQYEVHWAETIDEARGILSAQSIDLALVDIRLKSENGHDFVHSLRDDAATSSLPIVMLTASDGEVERTRALRAGADRYLHKPVSPAQLQRVVSDLLAARDDFWWTFSLNPQRIERLRGLLFDTVTEIPTLALVVEQLKTRVEAGEVLDVYCLELEPLFRLDERNYWDSFDQLRREFVRGLHIIVAPLLGVDAVIATSHSGANDFYAFVRRDPERTPSHVAREMELRLRQLLRDLRVDQVVADEIAIFAGSAMTEGQTIYAPRVLYNAVREAKDVAEKRESRYFQMLSERLSRAIREKSIETHFQPILDLNSRTIIGYEALSRGPRGTEIESPEVIFDLARDLQMVWELESLCITNVEPMLPQICERGYLFFNLESHFIQQLQHRGSDVLELLLSCGRKVVIEVTERSAIRDYGNFRRTLNDLKHLGFLIAVDDCGSGYATLEAVAEIHPDYLKVGHSLFNGLETDPIRRRLVDLVARCADSIGAKTIAEAIETEEQLKICKELNIAYGQGYLFARPAPWDQVSPLRFDE